MFVHLVAYSQLWCHPKMLRMQLTQFLIKFQAPMESFFVYVLLLFRRRKRLVTIATIKRDSIARWRWTTEYICSNTIETITLWLLNIFRKCAWWGRFDWCVPSYSYFAFLCCFILLVLGSTTDPHHFSHEQTRIVLISNGLHQCPIQKN